MVDFNWAFSSGDDPFGGIIVPFCNNVGNVDVVIIENLIYNMHIPKEVYIPWKYLSIK